MSFSARLTLAFRLALREMRGGLGGFYIFLACIAIGTGAIAAVNSLSAAMTAAIAAQGRTLLAGDVRFQLTNREARPDERAWLDSLGTVSVTTNLRSMLRLTDGSDQALVQVKGVDRAWPLYGRFRTDDGRDTAPLFATETSAAPVYVAPLLLERLGLKIGDTARLGEADVRIVGLVADEPDAVSEGFALAPRLLIARDALAGTGLVTTGSLIEQNYKLKLADPTAARTLVDQARLKFPEAGWSIRQSDKAAPALADNIERFAQFLTLVGLSALIVGGAGVANAVRAFMDEKREAIAIFKCLGAPASTVFMLYLFQIMMIALIAIAAGLVFGAVTPMVAAGFLKGLLPVDLGTTLYPQALAIAAAFGLLTTLAFAVLPLGQARRVPATALFRADGLATGGTPGLGIVLLAGLSLAALAALAILTAHVQKVAVVFLVATAIAFVVLRLVAAGIALAARRFPRLKSPALRLAVGNIHRPGALTPSVVLSLGLGLTLIVTLALIDGNLRRQLTASLPEKAPNFFFIDIQSRDAADFRTFLKQQAPAASIADVPMLRGRIMEINGIPVAKIAAAQEARWVLNGDRGFTYAADKPANATLTEGTWWAADYTGEPLVSFAEEQGKALGLKLGDSITVNVLGRNLSAKIANFRKVEWENLSINFVMVFSPNTFRGAPHAWLATLTEPDLTVADEAGLLKAVTNRYPTVTSIRVKDALDTVGTLVGQLTSAIRAAAAVTLVTSVLVLAGALSAGNRARTHDAVVLKTLGATRRLLIRAFVYEYLLLGLATAVFALAAGLGAAWYVIAGLMKLTPVFLPTVAGLTIVISLLTTVGIGLLGTWRILGQKAGPYLRDL